MKTHLPLWTVLCCAALTAPRAYPDGGMFPRLDRWRERRERALINEPEQKAAIFFRNGQEQLIISPSYAGPPGDFAWVVPVPSRPQIKIVRGELFHELARLVEPAPRRTKRAAKGGAAGMARRPGVTLLERKTVGAYDVSVLAATDSGALKRWLDRNGYYLPDAARGPIASYVRERWTFVACRIKSPQSLAAKNRSSGLQEGTLAPLRLTFAAPSPVYPMRLSRVNPESFKLLLYLVLPTVAEGEYPQNPPLTSWPGASATDGDRDAVAVDTRTGRYPTLAGIERGRLRVYWKLTTLEPQDCTRDYVWNLRR